MKLYKNKNIVAILTTFTILNAPIVSKGVDSNIDAYYDDTNINIEKRKSYTLKLSKEKLEELIKSNEEEIIIIKIAEEEVKINRKELISLKEKADEYDKKNKEYTIVISGAGAFALTTIILKDKIKQKIRA